MGDDRGEDSGAPENRGPDTQRLSQEAGDDNRRDDGDIVSKHKKGSAEKSAHDQLSRNSVGEKTGISLASSSRSPSPETRAAFWL